MRKGAFDVTGEGNSVAARIPFNPVPFGETSARGGVDGGGDIVLSIGSGSVQLLDIVVSSCAIGCRIEARIRSTSLGAPPPVTAGIAIAPSLIPVK